MSTAYTLRFPHKLIHVYELAEATVTYGKNDPLPIRCWALIETQDGPIYGRRVVPMVLHPSGELIVADDGGVVKFVGEP